MPVLSYLHQLFNADPCHAYMHPLRWQARPLQCPRCHSHAVSPWGLYHHRPGCTRSWCNGCERTLHDLTTTLLHQSTRSLPHWILATFLWGLAWSSRRLARELGGRVPTGYRWCWWLRNAALSSEMERQLEGTVEADELYHTAGQKGQAKHGGPKPLGRRARGRRKQRAPGRGPEDKDRPAMIAWVSRQGAVVLHAPKDCTVTTGQKAAEIAVRTGRRRYPDSASSYRAGQGYMHDCGQHTKKEYARGDVHEHRAAGLFSLLKPSLQVLRGLSTTNLPGSLGFLQFLRNFRQQNAFEQAELIFRAAFEPAVARRARKGACVTCRDHFDLLQTARN